MNTQQVSTLYAYMSVKDNSDLIDTMPHHLRAVLTLGYPTQSWRQVGQVIWLDVLYHLARHRRQKLWPQVRVVGRTIGWMQQLHIISESESDLIKLGTCLSASLASTHCSPSPSFQSFSGLSTLSIAVYELQVIRAAKQTYIPSSTNGATTPFTNF